MADLTTDQFKAAVARPADLKRVEVGPFGLGIHFPTLDADLHVPALLEGVLGSQSWLATHAVAHRRSGTR